MCPILEALRRYAEGHVPIVETLGRGKDEALMRQLRQELDQEQSLGPQESCTVRRLASKSGSKRMAFRLVFVKITLKRVPSIGSNRGSLCTAILKVVGINPKVVPTPFPPQVARGNWARALDGPRCQADIGEPRN